MDFDRGLWMMNDVADRAACRLADLIEIWCEGSIDVTLG